MDKKKGSTTSKSHKKNIVTKARLITTITTLFSLVFLLCIYAIYSIYAIDKSMDDIIKVNFITIESSMNMKHNIEDQNKLVLDYVHNEDATSRELTSFKIYSDSFNENLEILKSSITEEGEVVAVRMIKDSYNEYNYAINKIDQAENKYLYYYESIHPIYRNICDEINYLQKLNVKAINMKKTLSKNKIDFSKNLLNLSFVIMVIICVVASTKAINTADNMTNTLTQELINTSDKVIFVVNKNFELLQINKKAETVIGRTEYELVGRNLTELIDSQQINEYIINKGEDGPLCFAYVIQQKSYEILIDIKETNLEYLIISCTLSELKQRM